MNSEMSYGLLSASREFTDVGSVVSTQAQRPKNQQR